MSEILEEIINTRGLETPGFLFDGAKVKVNKYYNNLSKESILSKVSEYDIFKKYCGNFDKLNKSFCSDLRKDRNPSCVIYRNISGKLVYHDLSTDQYFDCFSYLLYKYSLSFKEVLEMLDKDIFYNKIERTNSESLVEEKATIKIFPRDYNYRDREYWSKYYVSDSTLKKFNVDSCNSIEFIKGNRKRTVYEKTGEPIYIFKFLKDNSISYKMYRPNSPEFKWYSPDKSVIQGWDQMPECGDLLVITKSMKDVMVLYELGITSIAPQSENIPIKKQVMHQLLRRFKKIVTLFDYDNTGIQGALLYRKLYDIEPFFLTDKLWNRKGGYLGAKDISDFILKFGVERSKKLINEKI